MWVFDLRPAEVIFYRVFHMGKGFCSFPVAADKMQKQWGFQVQPEGLYSIADLKQKALWW